jgi:DNA mismatch repair protein MutS
MPALAAKLAAAIVEDPPFALKEGGIFRDGYDADLDELRGASRDGKQWITELQEREIATTGIKSLKVRFNSVFGYFIEVTKSNLAGVPAHYTRKQTTVGGERFITPELKEMEVKILGADERARNLDAQLFKN